LQTNFDYHGDTLRTAQGFERFTRSSEARESRIDTKRIGNRLIKFVVQAVVDSVRNAVEARGRFAAYGVNPGNQLLRWHGTNRNCNVGDNYCTSLCRSPRCSLCCIIKTSFDIAHSKKKTGWGRFGNGIYTSSTSSKFVGYSPIVTMVLILFFAGQTITARISRILRGRPSCFPTWWSEMARSS